MASTKHPDMPDNIEAVVDQTRFTFDEDRVVIEAQYRNMREMGSAHHGSISTWTRAGIERGA